MRTTLAAIAAALALSACSTTVYLTPEPTLTPTTPAATATPEPTPEPTPTLKPSSTPEPTPEPPTMTPLNTFATVGDWDVRITKVNWDAAKALKSANQFNDPIPAGMTAVMVYVEGKYNGDGREKLDVGFFLRSVGPQGVEYTTFSDPTCGVMPDPDLDMDGPTVRKGATVKGWGACWVVDDADLVGLTAFADPFLSDDGIVAFALR